MKELVGTIVKALVDEPESVYVAETDVGDGSVTIEISVAEADVGKIIGKQGRIARAIRTVVKAVGRRNRKRVNVEILS